MSDERLSAEELTALVKRVFEPGAGENTLAIIVDVFRTHKGVIGRPIAFASTGEKLDAVSARRRANAETLVEIMQHKGDSECMISPGSGDEACGFEKLPYDRFGAKFSSFASPRTSGTSSLRLGRSRVSIVSS